MMYRKEQSKKKCFWIALFIMVEDLYEKIQLFLYFTIRE